MSCVFCDHDLSGASARPAYDPWLGRLWRVCPRCRRWNVVPLEDRWEALESLERAVRDEGRSVLSTDHLDLVEAGDRQVLRVGRAPRPELAGWRYGDLLPAVPGRGLLQRLGNLLRAIPQSPLGYDVSEAGMTAFPTVAGRWLGSPFLEDAPGLTAAFLHVPLAPECPSCGSPLAIAPWGFHGVRLTLDGGAPAVATACGVCGREVAVPARSARAGIRLGLSVVNDRYREESVLRAAAGELDRAAGPAGLLHRLASGDFTLGEAGLTTRLALGIALDEQWESELLEAEWKRAEEIAALVDGELTVVPGFDEFRRRVLRD